MLAPSVLLCSMSTKQNTSFHSVPFTYYNTTHQNSYTGVFEKGIITTINPPNSYVKGQLIDDNLLRLRLRFFPCSEKPMYTI
jgi:hypothetical protein